MANLPHIEVLLPVFNEKDCLAPLITQLDAARLELSGRARVTYLFVNDGSTDGTREQLDKLTTVRSDIRVFHLARNFGHSGALACGLDKFNADALVVMDADLQDRSDALAPLFDHWSKGSDTVVVERGTRSERFGFLYQFFYYLLHKASKNLPPLNFGTHCLLDRQTVGRLRTYKERSRYFPGLVALAAGKLTSIRLPRDARFSGSSRVGLGGLIHLAINAFLSFSNTPIRLVSILGIISSALAMGGGLTIIAIRVFTSLAIPGWASMMTAIALASGIQLLCLGLMGEYLARIHEEVKQRPLYLVEQEDAQPSKLQWQPQRLAASLDNP